MLSSADNLGMVSALTLSAVPVVEALNRRPFVSSAKSLEGFVRAQVALSCFHDSAPSGRSLT